MSYTKFNWVNRPSDTGKANAATVNEIKAAIQHIGCPLAFSSAGQYTDACHSVRISGCSSANNYTCSGYLSSQNNGNLSANNQYEDGDYCGSLCGIDDSSENSNHLNGANGTVYSGV